MNVSTVDRRRFLLGLGGATLALAGCNASAGSSPTPTAGPGSGFRWTDARGTVIDLPAVPTVVVAQSSAAATLWDFGFKVKGAYGELNTDADGRLNFQAGNLDLSQITVLSNTYGEFDLEKYAAMSPELLVDLVFVPPALWYVPEKSADQIEAIAPTLGIAMLNLDLLQIIENFAKLAGGLGVDLSAPLVTDAKTAFEASVTEVRAAVSANAGLRVLGISRSADKAWIANADQHPDFAYLKSLGVEFVDHQGKPTDYFTEVSYEELDKFSGDVIFDDARDRSIRSGADELATWKALPAVKAGQVFDWKAAAPYSYLTSAPILADVARALSGATRVTGANG